MITKCFSVSGIAVLVAAASVPTAFGDIVIDRERQIFTQSGTDAEVLNTLNQFREALGALNPNNPGSVGSGRREINWDAVPDSASAPNAFPADFFNANTP